MRKYLNYNENDIIEAVKSSFSIAGVLRKLNLKTLGGNYDSLRKKIAKLGLDTSHFTGQLWSKGLSLKDYKNYSKPKGLRLKLIKERGHKCEECKLEKWLEQDIKLEIHHINGKNNEPENLKLLCPNCHSLTPNFRKPKFNSPEATLPLLN